MANAQQTTNKAILVGEKSETKLTFLHRMFEDEMKNGSSADCALIYEGKFKILHHLQEFYFRIISRRRCSETSDKIHGAEPERQSNR